ncbi:MAG: hypothetical protein HY351_05300, partial [Candidatus Omnitrophica bacterium]|nr:hypothetical protein [Candidatus Omnitrophota bacterium]
MDIKIGFYGEAKAKTDLLVAACFEGEKSPPKALQLVDSGAFEVAKAALQKKRFNGKDSEQFASYDGDLKGTNELLLIGLGKKEKWSYEKFRKSVAHILRYGKSQNAKLVRVLAETFASGSIRTEDTAELIPETLD